MLHALAEYASKKGLAQPPGFKRKSARWIIVLTSHGDLVDVIREDRDFDICPDLTQGELIAGGVTRSHFLLDALSSVVGYDAKEREIDKHNFFVDLLEEAAGYEPVLLTIAQFLRDEKKKQSAIEKLRELRAKKTDPATFRVGDIYPVNLTSWHPWWNDFRARLSKRKGPSTDLMVCLLSGELVEPMETHFKISGLTAVGGQASGTVLAGFDKEAFCSYGLKQSQNAACSQETAAIYRNAMNDLIQHAPKPIAGSIFAHWFKEPVQPEDDPFGLLFETSEADEADALLRARRIFDSVTNGKRPELTNNRYYIMLLSGSGGRVMIRDWTEGDFGDLARNVQSWYEDLQLVGPGGGEGRNDFKLSAALLRMVSYRKGEDISKTYNRINEELAPIMPRVWHAILNGSPLPDTIASRALAYIRSRIYGDDAKKMDMVTEGNGEETKGIKGVSNLDRIACSLLKVWWNRKVKNQGGVLMQVGLNPDFPDPAYQAGRLLAILASLQESALGDVGAGIIQRYYTSASTAPALVIGRLVANAQHHLNKIESKGLVNWYENMIAEVMSKIGTSIPATLGLEGQTLFALGYYQQKAALRGWKRAEENETNLTKGDE